jgi:superfamily II DNA helicase RecQ
MRAKVLTLRFSPTLGRFDDTPLVALQQKVVLEHVRDHLVQVGDEVMLVCLASWREQQQQQQQQSPSTTAATPATFAVPNAPTDHDHGTPTTNPRNPARPVGELRAELDEQQRILFDKLRAWRSKTAHDEGTPPYVILTNRQLVELVLQRPDSKAGIGRMHGLGDKKVTRYGDAILQQLWGSQADTAKQPNEPEPEPEATSEPTAAALEVTP